MSKRTFIYIALAAFAVALVWLFVSKNANASYDECYEDCITPTIEVTPTPECVQDECITPEVTPEPTATPAAEVIEIPKNTQSDGLSSCPECTKAHNNNGTSVPAAPPKTGRAS